MTVKHQLKSIAIGAALFTLGGIGCGGGNGTGTGDDPGPLGSVESLIILQRPSRNDSGDIFQYTSYKPGARIITLSPPTADGKITPICCDKAGAEFANIDISSYDLSFDAKSIVFAGKLSDNERYGLFLLTLADGSVTQIATDPQHDFVSPTFLPGDRVMFTSNSVVEAGAPQHKDEYERGETIQLGRVNLDGTGMEMGPRNLSHRTAPSLASDGRVIFTQWDHLGNENSGHLMFVNQDMQELREGFGKEGKGASNSTLKAREISPGRYVAIATARSRTVNAGALIDIRLGDVENHDGVVSAPNNQAEANSSYRQLTPNVPMDGMPSSDTIGRYYDAFPLDAKDKPNLLVSWANGPVESGVLAAAGLSANFGVYLYDSEHQQRLPILDNPDMWDIFARPLQTRTAPNIVSSAQDPKLGGQTLIGSLNVYNSSLHTFKDGEIYGVRVMEGFSGEEGIADQFGTPRFEGHANLGVAPIAADKSWSAKIPANVPVHLQAVDQFGMSIFNEPVWFSGRAGEARMCGGCHEDRTKTTNVTPGQLDTFALGATELLGDKARKDRIKTDPKTPTEIVGVGWDTQVQPILDAHCISCHGDSNTAGIKPYTITDPTTGTSVSWTFNLTGAAIPAEFAVAAGGGAYSKSYLSMAGLDMEAVEKGKLMLGGNYQVYLNPTDAHGSLAITKLNPTVLFPTPSATRAFPTTPHMEGKGADLSPQEFYTLILAADMGVNFFARENNPHLQSY
jgi:Hydrazine synthase alpha subunit middle domain